MAEPTTQPDITIGTLEQRRRAGDEAEPYRRRMAHGSDRFIPRFDTGYMGHGNDQYGPGFHFTASQEDARLYGDRLTEASVTLQDPIGLDGGLQNNAGHVTFTPEAATGIIRLAPNMLNRSDMTSPSPIGQWIEEYWQQPLDPGGFDHWTERMGREHQWNLDMLRDLYGTDHATELVKAIERVTGHDGIVIRFPHGDAPDHAIAWKPAWIRDIGHADPRYREGQYPSTIREWAEQTGNEPGGEPDTRFAWESRWHVPDTTVDPGWWIHGNGPAAHYADTGRAPMPTRKITDDRARAVIAAALTDALERFGYKEQPVMPGGGAVEYGGFGIEPGVIRIHDDLLNDYARRGMLAPYPGEVQDLAHALGTAVVADVALENMDTSILPPNPDGGARREMSLDAELLDHCKDRGRAVGDMILESYGFLDCSNDERRWARETAAETDLRLIDPILDDVTIHDPLMGPVSAGLLLDNTIHDVPSIRPTAVERTNHGEWVKANLIPAADTRPGPDPWQDAEPSTPDPDPAAPAANPGPETATGPGVA